MKVDTTVTTRMLFDAEERDIVRQAAYADGVEDYLGRADSANHGALVQARAKALQGETGHGKGNAFTHYELRSMAGAVAYAIECGLCDEEEYSAWRDVATALERAADESRESQEVEDHKDIRFNKEHYFDTTR